jgi:hypothetical protein
MKTSPQKMTEYLINYIKQFSDKSIYVSTLYVSSLERYPTIKIFSSGKDTGIELCLEFLYKDTPDDVFKNTVNDLMKRIKTYKEQEEFKL